MGPSSLEPVGNADAPNLVCAVTQKNPISPMTAGVRLPLGAGIAQSV
jgi:hypothetical protein